MGLYEYARGGGGGGLSNIISQIENDIESPIQKHAASSYVKKKQNYFSSSQLL